ncbi:hypothetical protein AcV7_004560 [Taiwanofungus camphoratus]|nr:hypothetical protein AcV7_004560 [Antrodia cinnamomea]
MAVAVAVWSLAVSPDKPESIIPQSDLRITNVALADELKDENGRTTIKLNYHTPIAPEESDDEEGSPQAEPLSTTVLCSLIPSKIEQSTVDVVLEADEEYLFEVVGKNTVYLTGNYIDQSPPDQIPYNDESEDEDEEDFDLRDVSSDVQIDPDEIDIPSDDEGRFEELPDDAEVTKQRAGKKDAGKKRPRESDAMETEEGGEKLSKAQKKKANKKQKAEDGKAVPSGAEETPSPAKVNGDAQEKKGKKEKEKGEKEKSKKDGGEKEKPKAEGKEKELAGGLKVRDHKVGTGPQAKAGDMVSMRYVGKLQNGKTFDQNVKGDPFKFRLGKGEVIKGWDVGVAGMQVGGERLLVVPPSMGYGKKKSGPIPPNSTLTFECKLLKIG